MIGDKHHFEVEGFCPCCNKEVNFVSNSTWYRDNFFCGNCGCIPRERALMRCIEMFFPDWRSYKIHESSPTMWRGPSVRLRDECEHYFPSQYWSEKKLGTSTEGIVNIDIENQKSIRSNSFDLVITQDVFEHLYNPRKAAKEIARTLKKGGAHIFSVPLVNKDRPTEKWSVIKSNKVHFLHEEEYHSNPVDPEGSPVSFHYGYDLALQIHQWAKTPTMMVYFDDLSYGIRAEFIEILISRKY